MWKRLRRCSTRSARLCAAAALSILAIAAAPSPGRGEGTADPAALAAGILSSSRYQTEFPHGRTPSLVVHFLPSSFSRLLGMLALLLFATLLVLWITGRVLEARRRAEAGGGRDGPARREAAAGEEGDPARLAAQGRFDEAVHALLLLAISHLARTEEEQPGPSSTSREILDELPLEGERREAFARLIAQVEASLFGGRAVGDAEYRRCLASFRLLVPAGSP